MRLLFILCIDLLIFSLSYAALHMEYKNSLYRIGNTHMHGNIKSTDPNDILLVSAERDMTLYPVKNPSNPIFITKNPSFCPVGTSIKLKNDEKNMTGKIIAATKYYYQIDIPFKRGDSGKVICNIQNSPVGIVSHSISHNGKMKYFAVRTDNIQNDKMEKIKAADLLADWQIFNDIKEYEYTVMQGLQHCADLDEACKFLKSLSALPKKNITWKSSYLRNETERSQNRINNIYERIFNEKSFKSK